MDSATIAAYFRLHYFMIIGQADRSVLFAYGYYQSYFGSQKTLFLISEMFERKHGNIIAFTDPLTGHVLVQNPKRGICVFCKLTKGRTKSGLNVKVRHQCSECLVPLCSPKSERNCFTEYHKLFFKS